MTATELLEEANRLSRPCVFLRKEGDVYAGIWRGKGLIPAPGDSFEHWLSINGKYVPTLNLRCCLSIYANNEDCESGFVAVDEHATLPENTDGIKLFAHVSTSLPPIDGIFRFGSSKVKEWLNANGWQQDWPFNDNFKGSRVVHEYERRWQEQAPLYIGGAHAVLGGWHMPWPDGDWDELNKSRLVAWTFEESEPWIEAWKIGDDFKVFQRIT